MNGNNEVNSSEELSQELSRYYGGITDPNNHNPNNFRYLVHGFNPMNFSTKAYMTGFEIQDQKDGIGNKEGDGDQSIDLYYMPFRVGERVSVSMSLIDQNHIGTWGDTGLILGVPEGNIVHTATGDIGTLNYSKSRLLELKKQNYIQNGDQILENSSSNSYNEIVGLSKTNEGTINVIGFFAKVDEDGEYIDTVSSMQMENHARNAGLPLVKIPSSLDNLKIEVISNETYPCIFYYLGKLYYLSSPKKPASNSATTVFCKGGANHKYSFLEETELSSILDILGKEFPEMLAELGTREEIFEEYKKYKKLYYAPQFERDEYKKITSISFIRGTGKYKISYSIGSLSAMKVNVDREDEYIMRSMRGGIITHDNPWIDIGYDEVWKKLKQDIEEMEEESKREVIEFLENAREKIESHYKSYSASKRVEELLGGL